MRRDIPILLAAVSVLLASTPAWPAPRPTLEMRDSATHDQLSQTLRMARQKDPIAKLGPAAGKVGEDPAKAIASRDLVRDSAILCYRGFLTLVPKGAVLHLPDQFKDRFEAKDNMKIQVWKDFFQSNRNWIRTVEVSRDQAMGKAPMKEEIVKAFETGNFAIIATYKGGPISVMPYTEPASGETENPSVTSLNPANRNEP